MAELESPLADDVTATTATNLVRTRTDSAMTRRIERFRMVVPGDWTILPLDPKNRDRRIAGIVERRMPKGDRHAYMRRQSIVQLRKAAANAASKGAFFAAMHNTAAPNGLPMSASAMAAMVPPAQDADGNVLSDAAAIAAELAAGGKTEADHHGQVLEHSVVDLPVGQAARIRRRAGTGIKAQDGREVLAESVHFYVALPGGSKTLALIYSTPILSLADAYAGLFDVMAGTARWLEAPPDAAKKEEVVP